MGQVVSCGTDIVEISEIERLCKRYGKRFLRRILSEKELALAENRADLTSFVAGRFAAKEAVLKVLGIGIFQGVGLFEIEIDSRASGEPACNLRGKAREVALERGIGKVVVSISHCRSYAVAQAIGLKDL